MIHDIRGTNGSGKSTCVHELLKKYDHHVIRDEFDGDAGIFVPELNTRILGLYDSQCGGCDRLLSQTNATYIEHLAKTWYKEHDGPLIMEGIIIAHTFGRWNDLCVELGESTTFYFLDTPLETCIDRVKDRRRERGDEDADNFDPRNVVKDFDAIRRVHDKMKTAGRRVVELDHTNAPALFEEAVIADRDKN